MNRRKPIKLKTAPPKRTCPSCGKRRALPHPLDGWVKIPVRGKQDAPFTFRYRLSPSFCSRCARNVEGALRMLFEHVSERTHHEPNETS
jgi:hypothetical protein